MDYLLIMEAARSYREAVKYNRMMNNAMFDLSIDLGNELAEITKFNAFDLSSALRRIAYKSL